MSEIVNLSSHLCRHLCFSTMNDVLFYLKTPKEKKSHIRLEYRAWKNARRFIYYTGETITTKMWDKNKQRVKRSRAFPENAEINEMLDILSRIVKDTHRQYIRERKTLTREKLKSVLDEYLQRTETQTNKKQTAKPEINNLIQFAEMFVAERAKSHFLEDSTKKNDRKHLKMFKQYAQDSRKKLRWNTLGRDFYLDFIDWMYAPPRSYSQNYAGRILTELKGYVREAKARGLHNNTSYEARGLSIPEADTYPIALTIDEIYNIYNAELSTRQDKVRDIFIIGCFTGLRVSDLTTLEKASIKNNKGEKFLVFPRTQKTKVGVIIPLHPLLEKLLKKYNGKFPAMVSDTEINRIIKEVCKKVGLKQIEIIPKTKGGKEIFEKQKRWELVSCHTARRSFATNMAREGVDLLVIKELTGHKTIKSLLKYIRLDKEEKAFIASKSDFFKLRKAS